MAMNSGSAGDTGDAPPNEPPSPCVATGERLFTGGCAVLEAASVSADKPSTTGPRRVICTRVRGERPLPFLDREQTVVGAIPDLPEPGRNLRVYSAAGVCILQSSRIRLLVHGPSETTVVTRNSTYRITYVDEG